jgi:hypothetical protein
VIIAISFAVIYRGIPTISTGTIELLPNIHVSQTRLEMNVSVPLVFDNKNNMGVTLTTASISLHLPNGEARCNRFGLKAAVKAGETTVVNQHINAAAATTMYIEVNVRASTATSDGNMTISSFFYQCGAPAEVQRRLQRCRAKEQASEFHRQQCTREVLEPEAAALFNWGIGTRTKFCAGIELHTVKFKLFGFEFNARGAIGLVPLRIVQHYSDLDIDCPKML